MGKLSIVGIGPGNYENMSIGADRILRECDTIIGYTVYIELIRDWYPDKDYHTTPMTREAERCRLALELASQGRNAALICSGDSGIYGMAALVYELRGRRQDPEIRVYPGITAASSGGALLGAPLTDDFAVISLSDHLTSWEMIEKRLEMAAQSDLVLALYNPASKRRPDYLYKACQILLRYLPEDRLCGVARQIGRPGEEVKILTLRELCQFPADMFCTVFIGNGRTKAIRDRLITSRGYPDE